MSRDHIESVGKSRAHESGKDEVDVTTSFVVPAKAGTHNHKALLRCELLPQTAGCFPPDRGRRVWLPPFAGTTLSAYACPAAVLPSAACAAARRAIGTR